MSEPTLADVPDCVIAEHREAWLESKRVEERADQIKALLAEIERRPAAPPRIAEKAETFADRTFDWGARREAEREAEARAAAEDRCRRLEAMRAEFRCAHWRQPEHHQAIAEMFRQAGSEPSEDVLRGLRRALDAELDKWAQQSAASQDYLAAAAAKTGGK